MSFRTDKIRGAHPITPKKGIKEVDLNIKEKGMNDRITVGVKNRYNPKGYEPKFTIGDEVVHSYGHGRITHIRYDDNQAHYKINGKYVPESSIKNSWKMLPFSERKILIPRIWNETLTEDQRNSALDKLVGDTVPHSEYRRLVNAKWGDLPINLQDKLLDHYKYRTTLEYNGTEIFNTKHLPDNLEKSRDKTTAIIPNNKDVIIEFRPLDSLSKEQKKSHDVKEGLDKIEQKLNEAGAGGLILITQRKGNVIRVQGNYNFIKDNVQRIGKGEDKIGVQVIRVVNP